MKKVEKRLFHPLGTVLKKITESKSIKKLVPDVYEFIFTANKLRFEVDDAFALYEKERMIIVKSCAKKKEGGEVILGENGTYVIDPEMLEIFNEKLDKLMKETVEMEIPAVSRDICKTILLECDLTADESACITNYFLVEA